MKYFKPLLLLFSLVISSAAFADIHQGGTINTDLRIKFQEIPGLSNFKITCDITANQINNIYLYTFSPVVSFSAQLNGEAIGSLMRLLKGDNTLVAQIKLARSKGGSAMLGFKKFDNGLNAAVTSCTAVPVV